MRYWVYKCNSKQQSYAKYTGDWRKDFFRRKTDRRWGSTEVVEALGRLSPGDRIIAHQTDKNELVGLAEVVKLRTNGAYKDVILRPLELIGVKVRPLKKGDRIISAIPALQGGIIATLYEISNDHAEYYLRVAGSNLVNGDSAPKPLIAKPGGAGIGGTPEQNKLVEKAAVSVVTKHYKSEGWSVQDVSEQNRGYDLLCRRKKTEIHVEVKGSSGAVIQFPITANERECWQNDVSFVLAFVGKALNRVPVIQIFTDSKQFNFRPMSYIAQLGC